MKKFIIFSILIFIWGTASYGEIWYFGANSAGKKDGTSYDNRGDIEDLEINSFGISAGDTVYFCGESDNPTIHMDDDILSGAKDGDLDWPVSGSSGVGNEITISCNCSDQPNGYNAELTSNDWDQIITLKNKDYLIFDKMYFKDALNHIWADKKSNNIKVTRSYSNSSKQQTLIFRGDYIIIGGRKGNGNLLQNCGDPEVVADAGGCVVFANTVNNSSISYNSMIGTNTSSKDGIDGIVIEDEDDNTQGNIIIEHNYIANFPRENAIDVKGSTNITIRKNILVGGDVTNPPFEAAVHLQWGVTNVYFYGNVIKSGTGSGLFIQDNKARGTKTDNIYVWSNLIYKNDYAGISITRGRGEGVADLFFWNNTVVNNGKDPYNKSLTGFRLAKNIDSVFVKNNIFQNNRSKAPNYQTRQAFLKDSSSLNFQNNYWSTDRGAVTIFYKGADRNLSWFERNVTGVDNENELKIIFTNDSIDDYTTTQLYSGVVIGETYHSDADLGISEDSSLTTVNCGTTPGGKAFCPDSKSIILVDRDKLNSGRWGVGCFVYGKTGGVEDTSRMGLSSVSGDS